MRKMGKVGRGVLLRKVLVIETRAAMPLVGCHLASRRTWLARLERGLEVALDQRVFLKRVGIGSNNSKLRTPGRWRGCQEDSRRMTKIKKNRRVLIIHEFRISIIHRIQLRMRPTAFIILIIKLASARRTATTTTDLTTRSRRTKRSPAKWQRKSARIANAAKTASEAAFHYIIICLEHRSR